MVYLLFFYDMGMTMANAALCIVFAALFVRNRSPLHLWLAILFGLCTADIVLMYLFDFVPISSCCSALFPDRRRFCTVTCISVFC